MRVTSLVFGVGVVCSVVGCDQLTLPQRPSGNGQSPIDITNANQTVVQGETTDLYGAPATAWAVMNAQTNELTAFKWSLPLSSVTNVPPNTSALRAWLDIPQEVLEQTPFVGFTYDYMPVGHSPPGIYDVSHWEFHINTAARETIEAIDCSDPTFPPDDRLPIPFNEWFVVPPPLNCWPGMGIHVSHRRAPSSLGSASRGYGRKLLRG